MGEDALRNIDELVPIDKDLVEARTVHQWEEIGIENFLRQNQIAKVSFLGG